MVDMNSFCINRYLKLLLFVLIATSLGSCGSGSSTPQVGVNLKPWTESYIDSPFMVPDGSAIYFLHSPITMLDFLADPTTAVQKTSNLPGHQGAGTAMWWNTDLYVSYRNQDGTWTLPANLGANINTTNLECCPWVDDTQTTLIFTREGDVGNFAASRNYISKRPDKMSPWSAPTVLPGDIGDYGATGYHDLHMTPAGDLYAWSELGATPDGAMFEAMSTGANSWAMPVQMPAVLQNPTLMDSQPWLSADGQTIYYNRRDPVSGNTDLMMSTLSGGLWNVPQIITLINFADPIGALVWGEPSFSLVNNMLFVRFDTSVTGWKAELMISPKLAGGSIGTPITLQFASQ